ncbi:MAG TPA: class I SAM-dependent methyltransferase [Longimicrobiaceae bacterium]|nr:class I SAM-dependent methyltransferase [Longimicrobiaceae bacterium]
MSTLSLDRPPHPENLEVLTACPICDSTRLGSRPAPTVWIGRDHFAEVESRLALSHCRSCGFTFTNPRPAGELLRSFYNRADYHCHDASYAASDAADAAFRLSLLMQVCTPGTLLDLGCGAGALLHAASARGMEAYGVEPGDLARENLAVRGFRVYADLPEALAAGVRTAAVTMIHVLEHLPDARETLGKVRRMLEPGGILMVEVPNVGSLRARIAGTPLSRRLPRQGQRFQAFPIHLYYFAARQLLMILRQAGYDPISVRAVGMGVEEFFAAPVRPKMEAAPAVPAVAQPNRPAIRRRTISRAKQGVKWLISHLMMGEHLIVLARMTSE